MKAPEAIRFMIAQSGKTAVQASKEMERSPSFITSTLTKRTSPRVETFALMCDVFGYELQIVDKTTGDVINID